MAVQPDATRKRQIDLLIRSLLASGVWYKLDKLHVYAAHTYQASLLNWVGTSYAHSVVGTISTLFVTDRGFTSLSTTNYIDTNYRPGVGLSAEDDFSCGMKVTISPGGAGVNVLGAADTSGYGVSLELTAGGSNAVAKIGQTALAVFSVSAGDIMGMSRDAGNPRSYKNGAPATTGASATLAPNSIDIFEGCLNANGTPSNGGSGWQNSASYYGANLSDTENLALYNAVSTYMTAVGVP
jgi:hypothetical protein